MTQALSGANIADDLKSSIANILGTAVSALVDTVGAKDAEDESKAAEIPPPEKKAEEPKEAPKPPPKPEETKEAEEQPKKKAPKESDLTDEQKSFRAYYPIIAQLIDNRDAIQKWNEDFGERLVELRKDPNAAPDELSRLEGERESMISQGEMLTKFLGAELLKREEKARIEWNKENQSDFFKLLDKFQNALIKQLKDDPYEREVELPKQLEKLAEAERRERAADRASQDRLSQKEVDLQSSKESTALIRRNAGRLYNLAGQIVDRAGTAPEREGVWLNQISRTLEGLADYSLREENLGDRIHEDINDILTLGKETAGYKDLNQLLGLSQLFKPLMQVVTEEFDPRTTPPEDLRDLYAGIVGEYEGLVEKERGRKIGAADRLIKESVRSLDDLDVEAQEFRSAQRLANTSIDKIIADMSRIPGGADREKRAGQFARQHGISLNFIDSLTKGFNKSESLVREIDRLQDLGIIGDLGQQGRVDERYDLVPALAEQAWSEEFRIQQVAEDRYGMHLIQKLARADTQKKHQGALVRQNVEFIDNIEAKLLEFQPHLRNLKLNNEPAYKSYFGKFLEKVDRYIEKDARDLYPDWGKINELPDSHDLRWKTHGKQLAHQEILGQIANAERLTDVSRSILQQSNIQGIDKFFVGKALGLDPDYVRSLKGRVAGDPEHLDNLYDRSEVIRRQAEQEKRKTGDIDKETVALNRNTVAHRENAAARGANAESARLRPNLGDELLRSSQNQVERLLAESDRLRLENPPTDKAKDTFISGDDAREGRRFDLGEAFDFKRFLSTNETADLLDAAYGHIVEGSEKSLNEAKRILDNFYDQNVVPITTREGLGEPLGEIFNSLNDAFRSGEYDDSIQRIDDLLSSITPKSDYGQEVFSYLENIGGELRQDEVDSITAQDLFHDLQDYARGRNRAEFIQDLTDLTALYRQRTRSDSARIGGRGFRHQYRFEAFRDESNLSEAEQKVAADRREVMDQRSTIISKAEQSIMSAKRLYTKVESEYDSYDAFLKDMKEMAEDPRSLFRHEMKDGEDWFYSQMREAKRGRPKALSYERARSVMFDTLTTDLSDEALRKKYGLRSTGPIELVRKGQYGNDPDDPWVYVWDAEEQLKINAKELERREAQLNAEVKMTDAGKRTEEARKRSSPGDTGAQTQRGILAGRIRQGRQDIHDLNIKLKAQREYDHQLKTREGFGEKGPEMDQMLKKSEDAIELVSAELYATEQQLESDIAELERYGGKIPKENESTRGFKYSEETARLIKSLVVAGESIENVSKKLGLGESIIRDIAKSEGGRYEDYDLKFSDAEEKDLKKYSEAVEATEKALEEQKARQQAQEKEAEREKLRQDRDPDSARRAEHLHVLATDLEASIKQTTQDEEQARKTLAASASGLRLPSLNASTTAYLEQNLPDFKEQLKGLALPDDATEIERGLFESVGKMQKHIGKMHDNVRINFRAFVHSAVKLKGEIDKEDGDEKELAKARDEFEEVSKILGVSESAREGLLESSPETWTAQNLKKLVAGDFYAGEYAEIGSLIISVQDYLANRPAKAGEVGKKPAAKETPKSTSAPETPSSILSRARALYDQTKVDAQRQFDAGQIRQDQYETMLRNAERTFSSSVADANRRAAKGRPTEVDEAVRLIYGELNQRKRALRKELADKNIGDDEYLSSIRAAYNEAKKRIDQARGDTDRSDKLQKLSDALINTQLNLLPGQAMDYGAIGKETEVDERLLRFLVRDDAELGEYDDDDLLRVLNETTPEMLDELQGYQTLMKAEQAARKSVNIRGTLDHAKKALRRSIEKGKAEISDLLDEYPALKSGFEDLLKGHYLSTDNVSGFKAASENFGKLIKGLNAVRRGEINKADFASHHTVSEDTVEKMLGFEQDQLERYADLFSEKTFQAITGESKSDEVGLIQQTIADDLASLKQYSEDEAPFLKEFRGMERGIQAILQQKQLSKDDRKEFHKGFARLMKFIDVVNVELGRDQGIRHGEVERLFSDLSPEHVQRFLTDEGFEQLQDLRRLLRRHPFLSSAKSIADAPRDQLTDLLSSTDEALRAVDDFGQPYFPRLKAQAEGKRGIPGRVDLGEIIGLPGLESRDAESYSRLKNLREELMTAADQGEDALRPLIDKYGEDGEGVQFRPPIGDVHLSEREIRGLIGAGSQIQYGKSIAEEARRFNQLAAAKRRILDKDDSYTLEDAIKELNVSRDQMGRFLRAGETRMEKLSQMVSPEVARLDRRIRDLNQQRSSPKADQDKIGELEAKQHELYNTYAKRLEQIYSTLAVLSEYKRNQAEGRRNASKQWLADFHGFDVGMFAAADSYGAHALDTPYMRGQVSGINPSMTAMISGIFGNEIFETERQMRDLENDLRGLDPTRSQDLLGAAGLPASMTDRDIFNIRYEAAKGITQKDLAKQYSLRPETVAGIVAGNLGEWVPRVDLDAESTFDLRRVRDEANERREQHLAKQREDAERATAERKAEHEKWLETPEGKAHTAEKAKKDRQNARQRGRAAERRAVKEEAKQAQQQAQNELYALERKMADDDAAARVRNAEMLKEEQKLAEASANLQKQIAEIQARMKAKKEAAKAPGETQGAGAPTPPPPPGGAKMPGEPQGAGEADDEDDLEKQLRLMMEAAEQNQKALEQMRKDREEAERQRQAEREADEQKAAEIKRTIAESAQTAKSGRTATSKKAPTTPRPTAGTGEGFFDDSWVGAEDAQWDYDKDTDRLLAAESALIIKGLGYLKKELEGTPAGKSKKQLLEEAIRITGDRISESQFSGISGGKTYKHIRDLTDEEMGDIDEIAAGLIEEAEERRARQGEATARRGTPGTSRKTDWMEMDSSGGFFDAKWIDKNLEAFQGEGEWKQVGTQLSPEQVLLIRGLEHLNQKLAERGTGKKKADLAAEATRILGRGVTPGQVSSAVSGYAHVRGLTKEELASVEKFVDGIHQVMAAEKEAAQAAKAASRTTGGATTRQGQFTDEQVTEIRREAARGVLNLTELGEKYGKNAQTISKLVRGATYHHVPDISVEEKRRLSEEAAEERATKARARSEAKESTARRKQEAREIKQAVESPETIKKGRRTRLQQILQEKDFSQSEKERFIGLLDEFNKQESARVALEKEITELTEKTAGLKSEEVRDLISKQQKLKQLNDLQAGTAGEIANLEGKRVALGRSELQELDNYGKELLANRDATLKAEEAYHNFVLSKLKDDKDKEAYSGLVDSLKESREKREAAEAEIAELSERSLELSREDQATLQGHYSDLEEQRGKQKNIRSEITGVQDKARRLEESLLQKQKALNEFLGTHAVSAEDADKFTQRSRELAHEQRVLQIDKERLEEAKEDEGRKEEIPGLEERVRGQEAKVVRALQSLQEVSYVQDAVGRLRESEKAVFDQLRLDYDQAETDRLDFEPEGQIADAKDRLRESQLEEANIQESITSLLAEKAYADKEDADRLSQLRVDRNRAQAKETEINESLAKIAEEKLAVDRGELAERSRLEAKANVARRKITDATEKIAEIRGRGQKLDTQEEADLKGFRDRQAHYRNLQNRAQEKITETQLKIQGLREPLQQSEPSIDLARIKERSAKKPYEDFLSQFDISVEDMQRLLSLEGQRRELQQKGAEVTNPVEAAKINRTFDLINKQFLGLSSTIGFDKFRQLGIDPNKNIFEQLPNQLKEWSSNFAEAQKAHQKAVEERDEMLKEEARLNRNLGRVTRARTVYLERENRAKEEGDQFLGRASGLGLDERTRLGKLESERVKAEEEETAAKQELAKLAETQVGITQKDVSDVEALRRNLRAAQNKRVGIEDKINEIKGKEQKLTLDEYRQLESLEGRRQQLRTDQMALQSEIAALERKDAGISELDEARLREEERKKKLPEIDRIEGELQKVEDEERYDAQNLERYNRELEDLRAQKVALGEEELEANRKLQLLQNRELEDAQESVDRKSNLESRLKETQDQRVAEARKITESTKEIAEIEEKKKELSDEDRTILEALQAQRDVARRNREKTEQDLAAAHKTISDGRKGIGRSDLIRTAATAQVNESRKAYDKLLASDSVTADALADREKHLQESQAIQKKADKEHQSLLDERSKTEKEIAKVNKKLAEQKQKEAKIQSEITEIEEVRGKAERLKTLRTERKSAEERESRLGQKEADLQKQLENLTVEKYKLSEEELNQQKRLQDRLGQIQQKRIDLEDEINQHRQKENAILSENEKRSRVLSSRRQSILERRDKAEKALTAATEKATEDHRIQSRVSLLQKQSDLSRLNEKLSSLEEEMIGMAGGQSGLRTQAGRRTAESILSIALARADVVRKRDELESTIDPERRKELQAEFDESLKNLNEAISGNVERSKASLESAKKLQSDIEALKTTEAELREDYRQARAEEGMILPNWWQGDDRGKTADSIIRMLTFNDSGGGKGLRDLGGILRRLPKGIRNEAQRIIEESNKILNDDSAFADKKEEERIRRNANLRMLLTDPEAYLRERRSKEIGRSRSEIDSKAQTQIDTEVRSGAAQKAITNAETEFARRQTEIEDKFAQTITSAIETRDQALAKLPEKIDRILRKQGYEKGSEAYERAYKKLEASLVSREEAAKYLVGERLKGDEELASKPAQYRMTFDQMVREELEREPGLDERKLQEGILDRYTASEQAAIRRRDADLDLADRETGLTHREGELVAKEREIRQKAETEVAEEQTRIERRAAENAGELSRELGIVQNQIHQLELRQIRSGDTRREEVQNKIDKDLDKKRTVINEKYDNEIKRLTRGTDRQERLDKSEQELLADKAQAEKDHQRRQKNIHDETIKRLQRAGKFEEGTIKELKGVGEFSKDAIQQLRASGKYDKEFLDRLEQSSTFRKDFRKRLDEDRVSGITADAYDRAKRTTRKRIKADRTERISMAEEAKKQRDQEIDKSLPLRTRLAMNLATERRDADLARAEYRGQRRRDRQFRKLDKPQREVIRLGQAVQQMEGELEEGYYALRRLITEVIVAAGDMEAFEYSLRATAGSAELAKDRLQDLIKIAKEPGLTIASAMKGGVVLDALGLDKDLTDSTLKEFGNVVGLIGGGDDEMRRALLGLTQIVSKGQVLAEEINQMREISGLFSVGLENVFGTQSSEAISETVGIGKRQVIEKFVRPLISELGRLERAGPTGFINQMKNFKDSMFAIAASVGEVMLPHVRTILTFITNVFDKVKGINEYLQGAIGDFIVTLGGIFAVLRGVRFLREIGQGLPGIVQGIGSTMTSLSDGLISLAKSRAMRKYKGAFLEPLHMGRSNLNKFAKGMEKFGNKMKGAGSLWGVAIVAGFTLAMAAGVWFWRWYKKRQEEAQKMAKSLKDYEEGLGSAKNFGEWERTVRKRFNDLDKHTKELRRKLNLNLIGAIPTEKEWLKENSAHSNDHLFSGLIGENKKSLKYLEELRAYDKQKGELAGIIDIFDSKHGDKAKAEKHFKDQIQIYEDSQKTLKIERDKLKKELEALGGELVDFHGMSRYAPDLSTEEWNQTLKRQDLSEELKKLNKQITENSIKMTNLTLIYQNWDQMLNIVLKNAKNFEGMIAEIDRAMDKMSKRMDRLSAVPIISYEESSNFSDVKQDRSRILSADLLMREHSKARAFQHHEIQKKLDLELEQLTEPLEVYRSQLGDHTYQYYSKLLNLFDTNEDKVQKDLTKLLLKSDLNENFLSIDDVKDAWLAINSQVLSLGDPAKGNYETFRIEDFGNIDVDQLSEAGKKVYNLLSEHMIGISAFEDDPKLSGILTQVVQNLQEGLPTELRETEKLLRENVSSASAEYAKGIQNYLNTQAELLHGADEDRKEELKKEAAAHYEIRKKMWDESIELEEIQISLRNLKQQQGFDNLLRIYQRGLERIKREVEFNTEDLNRVFSDFLERPLGRTVNALMGQLEKTLSALHSEALRPIESEMRNINLQIGQEETVVRPQLEAERQRSLNNLSEKVYMAFDFARMDNGDRGFLVHYRDDFLSEYEEAIVPFEKEIVKFNKEINEDLNKFQIGEDQNLANDIELVKKQNLSDKETNEQIKLLTEESKNSQEALRNAVEWKRSIGLAEIRGRQDAVMRPLVREFVSGIPEVGFANDGNAALASVVTEALGIEEKYLNDIDASIKKVEDLAANLEQLGHEKAKLVRDYANRLREEAKKLEKANRETLFESITTELNEMHRQDEKSFDKLLSKIQESPSIARISTIDSKLTKLFVGKISQYSNDLAKIFEQEGLTENQRNLEIRQLDLAFLTDLEETRDKLIDFYKDLTKAGREFGKSQLEILKENLDLIRNYLEQARQAEQNAANTRREIRRSELQEVQNKEYKIGFFSELSPLLGHGNLQNQFEERAKAAAADIQLQLDALEQQKLAKYREFDELLPKVQDPHAKSLLRAALVQSMSELDAQADQIKSQGRATIRGLAKSAAQELLNSQDIIGQAVKDLGSALWDNFWTLPRSAKEALKELDEDTKERLDEINKDAEMSAEDKARRIEEIERDSAKRRLEIETQLAADRKAVFGDVVKNFIRGIGEVVMATIHAKIGEKITNKLLEWIPWLKTPDPDEVLKDTIGKSLMEIVGFLKPGEDSTKYEDEAREFVTLNSEVQNQIYSEIRESNIKVIEELQKINKTLNDKFSAYLDAVLSDQKFLEYLQSMDIKPEDWRSQEKKGPKLPDTSSEALQNNLDSLVGEQKTAHAEARRVGIEVSETEEKKERARQEAERDKVTTTQMRNDFNRSKKSIESFVSDQIIPQLNPDTNLVTGIVDNIKNSVEGFVSPIIEIARDEAQKIQKFREDRSAGIQKIREEMQSHYGGAFNLLGLNRFNDDSLVNYYHDVFIPQLEEQEKQKHKSQAPDFNNQSEWRKSRRWDWRENLGNEDELIKEGRTRLKREITRLKEGYEELKNNPEYLRYLERERQALRAEETYRNRFGQYDHLRRMNPITDSNNKTMLGILRGDDLLGQPSGSFGKRMLPEMNWQGPSLGAYLANSVIGTVPPPTEKKEEVEELLPEGFSEFVADKEMKKLYDLFAKKTTSREEIPRKPMFWYHPDIAEKGARVAGAGHNLEEGELEFIAKNILNIPKIHVGPTFQEIRDRVKELKKKYGDNTQGILDETGLTMAQWEHIYKQRDYNPKDKKNPKYMSIRSAHVKGLFPDQPLTVETPEQHQQVREYFLKKDFMRYYPEVSSRIDKLTGTPGLFKGLGTAQQLNLMDLAYNVGLPELENFKKTIAGLKEYSETDYIGNLVYELFDSKIHRDLGARSTERITGILLDSLDTDSKEFQQAKATLMGLFSDDPKNQGAFEKIRLDTTLSDEERYKQVLKAMQDAGLINNDKTAKREMQPKASPELAEGAPGAPAKKIDQSIVATDRNTAAVNENTDAQLGKTKTGLEPVAKLVQPINIIPTVPEIEQTRLLPTMPGDVQGSLLSHLDKNLPVGRAGILEGLTPYLSPEGDPGLLRNLKERFGTLGSSVVSAPGRAASSAFASIGSAAGEVADAAGVAKDVAVDIAEDLGTGISSIASSAAAAPGKLGGLAKSMPGGQKIAEFPNDALGFMKNLVDQFRPPNFYGEAITDELFSGLGTGLSILKDLGSGEPVPRPGSQSEKIGKWLMSAFGGGIPGGDTIFGYLASAGGQTALGAGAGAGLYQTFKRGWVGDFMAGAVNLAAGEEDYSDPEKSQFKKAKKHFWERPTGWLSGAVDQLYADLGYGMQQFMNSTVSDSEANDFLARKAGADFGRKMLNESSIKMGKRSAKDILTHYQKGAYGELGKQNSPQGQQMPTKIVLQNNIQWSDGIVQKLNSREIELLAENRLNRI